MMDFSEMPLALTPAAGRLLTAAVVSAGLASGADLASALPLPFESAADTAAAGASAPGLLTM